MSTDQNVNQNPNTQQPKEKVERQLSEILNPQPSPVSSPTEVSPDNQPKSPADLEKVAIHNELKKEIKPLLHEICERVNRLDSQEKDGQEPLRDIYGKSAHDYLMLKYKLTLGELKDDPVGQLRALRPLFHGLGPSKLDEKQDIDKVQQQQVKDSTKQVQEQAIDNAAQQQNQGNLPAQGAQ